MSARAGLIALIACLLMAPATARGHISVVPAQAQTGITTPFVVQIPNERDVTMTTVRVSVPSAIRVADRLTPPAGWTVNPLVGQGSDLAGGDYDGELAPGEVLEVTLVGTPLVPGEAVWRVEQTFADGERVLWTARPDPGASEEPAVGEPGPAVVTTITGAALDSPPGAQPAPDAGADPEAPDSTEPGAAETGGRDVRSWALVIVGAIAVLALGVAGWMWSNRPMDLPPDDDVR